MQGYGAIQIGRHVFARAGEPGSEAAKFVHLWKRDGDRWRLARVLSFDHRHRIRQGRRPLPRGSRLAAS